LLEIGLGLCSAGVPIECGKGLVAQLEKKSGDYELFPLARTTGDYFSAGFPFL
jgi:hypothetical protein